MRCFMKRLVLFAAIGISSFTFAGFSHGVVLPTSHSDLAFNRPTDAQTKFSREEKEREEKNPGEPEERRRPERPR
jgi:hypothetical protein